MPPTNHTVASATRSLLSRSRVDWAIEAAHRDGAVGAEPVGALGEAGLASAWPRSWQVD